MNKCKKKPRSALKNHWSIVDKACHRHAPRDIWLSQVSSQVIPDHWILGDCDPGLDTVASKMFAKRGRMLNFSLQLIWKSQNSVRHLVHWWRDELKRKDATSFVKILGTPLFHTLAFVSHQLRGLPNSRMITKPCRENCSIATWFNWAISEVLRRNTHLQHRTSHSYLSLKCLFCQFPLPFASESHLLSGSPERVVYKACLGMFYASNQRLASGILAGNWPTNAHG